MSYVEFQTEAKKCIEIHSHLSTCLYDWAVAHTLYEQQVLCWSTTVAYYAMQHSARTLFALIEFDRRFEERFNSNQTKQERLRWIMKHHTPFCLFLQRRSRNQNDRSLLDDCTESFKEYFPNVDWSSYLMSYGSILELHKEAREAENYEHFVVAHHGREYHFESPFIETLFKKSEENANKYVPEILNYIHKFYERQIPMREHHLWHLKDELWWLEKTMEKEKLCMSGEMIAFLDTLKNLAKDVRMPANFFDFEKEMDMKYYSAKNKVYRDLEDLAEKLAPTRSEG